MASDFKAYPKPWEVSLSKTLNLFLTPARIAILIYCIILLFEPEISWKRVIVLYLIFASIQVCEKYNNAFLKSLEKTNDD